MEKGAEAAGLDFVTAMDIARSGFQDWATKPHNARWARKIDGTPIPNDLLVSVAMAFVAALPLPPPPNTNEELTDGQ